MLNPITQKDNLGCAVACTAFVLNRTYEETFKMFGKNTNGYLCKEIIAILKKYGENYYYRYLTPKLRRNIYFAGTIVFIKRSKKYPSGHYLARANNCWMDSWVNFKNDKNINNAGSGFRKRLPEKPIYGLFNRLP